MALAEAGAATGDVEQFDVPGAFELPQAARCVAETGRFDAIVCLGCVIRGATPHFEYISSAVAHGIMEAAGETGIPIADQEHVFVRCTNVKAKSHKVTFHAGP